MNRSTFDSKVAKEMSKLSFGISGWITKSPFQITAFSFADIQILIDALSRTTDNEAINQRNLKICADMLLPYLKIWEWEMIFEHAVKAISSPGVRSPCTLTFREKNTFNFGSSLACFSISSQKSSNLRSLISEPNLDSFSEMLPILPEKDKKYDLRQFLSLIIILTPYKQFLN